jgi:hypothetical protein
MYKLYFKATIILCVAFFSLLFIVGCEEDSPSEPNGNGEQTITVSGFVKDFNGEPVTGALVIIKGKGPVTTDANGGFTVSNVSKPYEARVIFSTDQTALVYQGLTRSDPTLLYLGFSSSLKTATISGTVPPAAGNMTKVIFVSSTMAWSTTANEVTGAYSIIVDWSGAANSVSGDILVLRWTQNTSGMPAQYNAYGTEDNLTVSAGGSFTNHNFSAANLTDPPEQNISGSIVRPTTSYQLYNKDLYLFFGNAEIPLGGEWGASLSDNFSYVVPSIAGATFGIDASASLNATPTYRETFYGKRGITAGSSGITINLASSPQLNIPAHNGSGIDTTTQFLWTMGSGGGINLLSIAPVNWGAGPIYYIFTSANSASIPNLAPQGLGLPSNIQYRWSITQMFPVSSIDDVANPTFLQLTTGGTDGGQANSEEFNFTTKTSP